MSRPEYCDMVLNKLPESKVLFNKQIVRISTLEGSETGTFNDEHGRQDSILDSDDLEKQPPQLGVVCTCADGSVYSAHVVVGDVDSRIERKVDVTQQPQQTPQSIMRHRRSGTGSGSSMISGGVSGDRKDSSSREFQYFVSGITEPLDPQRIPLLREDTTQLRLAIDAKSPFSVSNVFLLSLHIFQNVLHVHSPGQLRGTKKNLPFMLSMRSMLSKLHHSGGQQRWWTTGSHGR